ncbi:MAG: deoxyribonuclease IV [Erysipelotrichaceae bacterium]|nr:deoxyribonuclease IV [Erysipelotrichaceae bacterium]MDD3809987.1 deoxyribonuclease IV [Erysipelotrichaceae bacterium]
MIIGSHVSLKAPDMLLGSVKEALSYNSDTFMFYTGAPQNTRRKDISEFKVDQAKELMERNGIDINNVIVHSPYIINLANTIKKETYQLAVDFLKIEIDRCEQIGAKTLVLHPGSHVQAGDEAGLDSIVAGLNEVLSDDQDVIIALETMAGKGSELGRNLKELKYIYDNCQYKHLLGICLDTCHLHDSGVDISKFDEFLDEFDRVLGIDKIKCIHINDSKNKMGMAKDRHENIGYGYIGFENLYRVVTNPRIKHIPLILETPYCNNKPPYKKEIEMLRSGKFEHWLEDKEILVK